MQSRSSGVCCAFVGCKNNWKKLRIWKDVECEIHNGMLHKDCPCLQPFTLHRFPKNEREKQLWIAALNRKNYVPGKLAMVCGIHFRGGYRSKEHSIPTLHLGHDSIPHITNDNEAGSSVNIRAARNYGKSGRRIKEEPKSVDDSIEEMDTTLENAASPQTYETADSEGDDVPQISDFLSVQIKEEPEVLSSPGKRKLNDEDHGSEIISDDPTAKRLAPDFSASTSRHATRPSLSNTLFDRAPNTEKIATPEPIGDSSLLSEQKELRKEDEAEDEFSNISNRQLMLLILKNLEEVQQIALSNAKMLQRLHFQMRTKDTPTAPKEDPPPLPCSDKHDLLFLESYLEGYQKKEQLTEYLADLIGPNKQMPTNVRKLLNALFSVDLAKKMNWTGTNNKLCFKDLSLTEVVFAAVKSVHANVKLAEVTDVIKGWFRQSRDRGDSCGERPKQNMFD